MSFSNKLNNLFKSLTLKNSVISQIADVDASLISRFRSGIRTPKPNSPQLDKLCNGIIAYATDNNKINAINSVCGFPSDMDGATLLAALKVWLLDTKDSIGSNEALTNSDMSPKFLTNFGKKLDEAMILLDLSNINLSKALGVDPSLVSRFRNGSRTPSTKNSSIHQICLYLYKSAKEQNQLNELYKLVKLNPSTLNNDTELIIDYISDWICDRKEMAEYTTVSSFLNNLNWMTSNKITFPPIEEIVTPPSDPNKKIFHGYEGLRDAFNKIAYTTLTTPGEHSIYIYIDQNLEWIHEKKGYIDNVISSFLKAVDNKHTINLLHSMTHTPSDVFFQIERFLPMHAMGNFKSYYLPTQQTHVFSHIRIVVPGVACLIGDSVKGHEDVGEYYYIDDERLALYKQQIEHLFEKSKSLLTTIPKEEGSPAHSMLENIKSLPHARIALQYTLPIDGMDRELFDKIISFNHIDASYTSKATELFLEHQSKNTVKSKSPMTEYVPLANISSIPSNEKMQSTSIEELLNDPNYVMVPVNLYSITPSDDNIQIYYTRETYIEHVRALINILKIQTNYNLVPVEFKPYRNLKLMLVEGNCIISCNNTSGVATYVFNHDLLNNLFREYIYSLQHKHYKGTYTKEEAIKFLENYIRFW